jgi:transcriptional regulator with XRE-family HTH domain
MTTVDGASMNPSFPFVKRFTTVVNTMVDLDELKGLTLGQTIKYLRDDKGLTQTELSEDLGLSQKWGSDIERGVYKHSTPETLGKISEYFGIPDYILLSKAGFGSDRENATKFYELTKPDPEERAQSKRAIAEMRTEATSLIAKIPAGDLPYTLLTLKRLAKIR